MALPQWPASLWLPAQYAFSNRERRRVQSESHDPPAFRRFARDGIVDARVQWRFIASQMSTFSAFYDADLAIGARWFSINLPGRGGVIERAARFIGPPRVSHVSSGVFDVAATLEVTSRVPSAAFSEDCAEDFSSFNPSVQMATLGGEPEPSTPIVIDGALWFLAANFDPPEGKSGAWLGEFLDCPAQYDFDLRFDFIHEAQNMLPDIGPAVFTSAIVYRISGGMSGGFIPFNSFAVQWIFADLTLAITRGATILASTSYVPGVTASYRLVVSGQSHRLWRNDALLFDITDENYTTAASKITLHNATSAEPNGRVSAISDIRLRY